MTVRPDHLRPASLSLTDARPRPRSPRPRPRSPRPHRPRSPPPHRPRSPRPRPRRHGPEAQPRCRLRKRGEHGHLSRGPRRRLSRVADLGNAARMNGVLTSSAHKLPGLSTASKTPSRDSTRPRWRDSFQWLSRTIPKCRSPRRGADRVADRVRGPVPPRPDSGHHRQSSSRLRYLLQFAASIQAIDQEEQDNSGSVVERHSSPWPSGRASTSVRRIPWRGSRSEEQEASETLIA